MSATVELMDVAGRAGATAPSAGPWREGWRALRRDRTAVVAAVLLSAVVGACLAAPLYAHHVAHTGPNTTHLLSTIERGGRRVPVVSTGSLTLTGGQAKLSAGGVPIGPQWLSAHGRYLLGADELGRDAAVRVLYGGRVSLLIGVASALICVVTATALAIVAGYFGGPLDWVISRAFDIIWAFPVMLLGIALGTALSISGFHRFGVSIEPGSLWIPILVIGYTLVPYVGRPIRARVMSLREQEFVHAARLANHGPLRIMAVELLPNVASTAIVMFALAVANNILFEAGLSFLGAGVQPPNASWGTLIADGKDHLLNAPWLSIVPGLLMLVTSLSLNLLSDSVRTVLDPKAAR